MDMSYLIFGSLGLIILSLIAIPLLPVKYQSSGALFLVTALAVFSSVPIAKVLFTNSTLHFSYVFSYSLGTISLRIDSLSAWFMLIINIVCFSGAMYGKGYLKAYLKQKNNTSLHWILFVALHIAMLWVCMAQQAFVFLISWEIMSLSALLLIMFDHEKIETLQAGLNYLIQAHLGVILITTGFIWVYAAEGSFDFNAIQSFFSHHSPIGLFMVFFTGFGIKAGFVPLHTWLPKAHPAAPSNVSGVMSGVVVKMGIYGLLRITSFLQTDFLKIGEGILLLSLITAFYGILNAAVHRDFKRMLAYCTIENIGIIGMALGVALIGKAIDNPLMVFIGFAAVLLHTLNHALYKSLLFFTAGNIYQQTHTRDMEKLGGLIKPMPQTGIFFLIGGMAIGGLPPFNGFVSEFLLYAGILIGIKSMGVAYATMMIFSLAGLALIGGISMLTFTKVFGTIFLGSPRTHLHQQPKEVSLLMRLPQYFILVIMLSISLFPQFYLSATSNVASIFIPAASSAPVIPASLINSMASIGKFSMLFLIIIGIILFIKKIVTIKRPVATGPTWGCGYAVPSAKMQYTGKSFSKSLGKLLNFITLEKKKYKEIPANEIFPKKRKHSSHYKDLFETKVLNVIIDRFLYSLNYFKFIQNGNIQLYILYGVFFIVLVFLGTIFKFI
jgi:formate hydrogenlyase subunit 3/multisubunit Na+/H+ antiporter MnhD subunit